MNYQVGDIIFVAAYNDKYRVDNIYIENGQEYLDLYRLTNKEIFTRQTIILDENIQLIRNVKPKSRFCMILEKL